MAILFFRFFLFLGLCLFFTVQARAEQAIILQSTTSAVNSGLYDYLLPFFERKTGIKVYVVSSGTGKAVQNAIRGDGDALLIHSEKAEIDFIQSGFGIERHEIMYNDFVLIGPESDSAKVGQHTTVAKALQAIAEAKARFISRGDDSGTHRKELSLWQQNGFNPAPHSGTWYLETGAGMGTTLNMAIELEAYSLTDRATWLKFARKGDATILLEGDSLLLNPYSIIAVNPEKHPYVKAGYVKKLIRWLKSPEGRKAIADYRLEGQPLFFPSKKGR